MSDLPMLIGLDKPQHRPVATGFEQFDAHGSAQSNSVQGHRILKLLCHAHHVIYLALLICTCDLVVALALACYGATIGLILAALRMTRERNWRFSYYEELPNG